jgi:hypothetical protein
MKRALLAAVGLTAACAAAAVPMFTARSASAQYGLLIDIPQRLPAIDASFVQCLGSVCFDNQVHAGSDGLASRGRAHPSWTNIHSVDVFTEATVRGDVTLVAPPSQVPAPVQTEVSFHLSGATVLAVDASSAAWSGLRLMVAAGQSSAGFTEYVSAHRQPPADGSYAMWRSGPDTVTASLTLPAGRFSFWIDLTTLSNAYTQLGQYDVTADYRVSFIEGQPVFRLPAGYTLWSTDFDIVDNQWCPHGCAPVPEPGSWTLMMAGLAGMVVHRRHRQRLQAPRTDHAGDSR